MEPNALKWSQKDYQKEAQSGPNEAEGTTISFSWWKSAPKGDQQKQNKRCAEKVGTATSPVIRSTRPGSSFFRIYFEKSKILEAFWAPPKVKSDGKNKLELQRQHVVIPFDFLTKYKDSVVSDFHEQWS